MKSTPPSHGPKGLQFPAGMRSPYRWVGEKSLPSSCLMCCGAASLWQASGHLALPWESHGTSQPSLGQHSPAGRQGQAGRSPREVPGDQGGRGPVPRRRGRRGHTGAQLRGPTPGPLSHQTALHPNLKIRVSIVGTSQGQAQHSHTD